MWNPPGLPPGLLGGLVLGDGLGALGDGVLRELAREDEADGGLDLAGGHGLPLVETDEFAGFGGDPGEGVADKGVQDRHSALGNSGVRVDLLEDTVDVDVVGLTRLAAVLLPFRAAGSLLAGVPGSGHLGFGLSLSRRNGLLRIRK